MVSENFHGLMEQAIQANTTMEENTVKELSFSLEEKYTKGNGKMAVKMDKEFFETIKTRQ